MQTKNQKRVGASGMTLVEVLVAVTFLSILVGGIYAGMIQALSLSYSSAQRVAAFGLCREWLEQMRSVSYDQVTTTTFAPQSLVITHLGGSRRIPLPGQRSCAIQELTLPKRKAVMVSLDWSFRGRSYGESACGVIFFRDETSPPILGGDVGGAININPNNSPDNEFSLILPDGSVIARDDLHLDYPGYTGSARQVFVRPKGNGDQNSLTLNGAPFVLENANGYTIAADSMTVDLYNDLINPLGKAVGKWWIAITATGGTIETK